MHTRHFAMLALVLTGCAHAPQPASQKPETAAGKPAFDIDAHLKREAARGTPHEIAAPDGSFTAKVEAAAPPRVTLDNNGTAAIAIPIGTDSVIDCALRVAQRLDSAALIDRLVQAPVKKFPTHGVQAVDAGAYGSHPFLRLEMYYLTADKKLGLVKGIVVAFADQTLACSHDELGYSQSMRRVVEQLAVSLHFRDASPPLKRHAIHVLRAHGHNLGFVEESSVLAKDKSWKDLFYSAAVIVDKQQQAITRDAADVASNDSKGEIDEWTTAVKEGGAMKHKLTIKRVKTGQYHVEGEAKGTPIAGEFASALPYYGREKTARQIVAHAKSKQPLELASYKPDTDPIKAFVKSLVPQSSSTDALVFQGTDGEEKAELIYDSRGIERGIRATHFEAERVYLADDP